MPRDMLPQPFWTTKYTRFFDILIDGMSAWAAQLTLCEKLMYARLDEPCSTCRDAGVLLVRPRLPVRRQPALGFIHLLHGASR